jgi:hypothetical protein
VDNFDLTALQPGSETLNGLLDVAVECAVVTSSKTKDDGTHYRNVYLNKKIGGVGTVAGGPKSGGRIVKPGAEEPDVPADTDGLGAAGEAPPAPVKDDDDIPF